MAAVISSWMVCCSIFIISFVINLTSATLPSGCLPLDEQPLSLEDVSPIFGPDSRLSQYGPRWVGNLRSQGALPTQHFASNQIKTEKDTPMRLMPYSCKYKQDGSKHVSRYFSQSRHTDKSTKEENAGLTLPS